MDIKSKLSSSRLLFAIAIIIAVSLAVYANTLFNGFVYDDNDQVLKNSWIRDIRHLPDIFFSSVWSFLEDRPPSVYYYRPMMYLIYTVEYYLFGLNPWWWHLVNIIFHAMNSIMVFLIALMLFNKQGTLDQPQISNPQSPLMPALIAALLFATHPINTEAVAWISAVPELSFTLFSLLAFYFYMKSSAQELESGITPSYLLSAAFCFLALLSKETAIILPALILAYDYYLRPPVKQPFGMFYTLFRRYLPYIFVIGIYFSIRIYVLWDMVFQRPEPSYLSNFNYIINILQLICQYFSKLLLPIDLNIFHDFRPVYSIMDIMDIIGLPIILSYLLLLYLARGRGKLILFALAWIITSIMPALYTLGITENPFAERYLYLPSIGFAILLAAGLNGISQMNFLTRKTGIYISIPLFLIVTGLYSTETAKRSFIWKDDIILWTDSVKKSPYTSTAHYNLGVVYQNRGLLEDARKEYQESLRLKPRSADAHYQLGNIYVNWYLLDSAIVEFQEALRIKPDYQEAQRELERVFNLKQLQDNR